MAHKGLREFDASELSSIAIGQQGFHVVGAGEVEAGVTAGYENIAYWVGIKAIDDNSVVEARSLADGSDFTKHATYIYQSNAAASGIEITNGDIVYGAFDKIEVASGDFVLLYIGRTI